MPILGQVRDPGVRQRPADGGRCHLYLGHLVMPEATLDRERGEWVGRVQGRLARALWQHGSERRQLECSAVYLRERAMYAS